MQVAGGRQSTDPRLTDKNRRPPPPHPPSGQSKHRPLTQQTAHTRQLGRQTLASVRYKQRRQQTTLDQPRKAQPLRADTALLSYTRQNRKRTALKQKVVSTRPLSSNQTIQQVTTAIYTNKLSESRPSGHATLAKLPSQAAVTNLDFKPSTKQKTAMYKHTP
jgi:hypothetical protein